MAKQALYCAPCIGAELGGGTSSQDNCGLHLAAELCRPCGCGPVRIPCSRAWRPEALAARYARAPGLDAFGQTGPCMRRAVRFGWRVRLWCSGGEGVERFACFAVRRGLWWPPGATTVSTACRPLCWKRQRARSFALFLGLAPKACPGFGRMEQRTCSMGGMRHEGVNTLMAIRGEDGMGVLSTGHQEGVPWVRAVSPVQAAEPRRATARPRPHRAHQGARAAWAGQRKSARARVPRQLGLTLAAVRC
jgi:hypothetical protein